MLTSRVSTVFAAPASALLRGWSADNDAYEAGSNVLTSACRFTFTLPADFVTGDPISLFVDGGVFADTTFPDDWTVYTYFVIEQINGGAGDLGPYSVSGHSYAPGVQQVLWPSDTEAWTTEGFQLSPTEYFIQSGNNGGYTLIDGGLSYPGEGCTPPPTSLVPIGWRPYAVIGNDEIPDDSVVFTAGATYTAIMGADTYSFDNANPTLGIYAAFRGITIDTGASGVITVPVDSVQTGFNLGAASVAWTDGAPFNDLSTVTVGPRPEAGGYQDMYLTDTP